MLVRWRFPAVCEDGRHRIDKKVFWPLVREHRRSFSCFSNEMEEKHLRFNAPHREASPTTTLPRWEAWPTALPRWEVWPTNCHAGKRGLLIATLGSVAYCIATLGRVAYY